MTIKMNIRMNSNHRIGGFQHISTIAMFDRGIETWWGQGLRISGGGVFGMWWDVGYVGCEGYSNHVSVYVSKMNDF